MNSLQPYISLLNEGNVVAIPTETVYGLAAPFDNEEAVKKVFELKGRPNDNPLIVHIQNTEQLELLCLGYNADVQKLIDTFWPGPLSIILKKSERVSDWVSGHLDTVAIRMPNQKETLDLIKETGPLVAPSANLSGTPSPTSAAHVKADFGADFPVIEADACVIGLESTVIDCTKSPFVILRPGAIGVEDIKKSCGLDVDLYYKNEAEPARSPGMKYRHYAPKAKVFWYDDEAASAEKLLVLIGDKKQQEHTIVLKDSQTLGQQIYSILRQADELRYKEIYIQKPKMETAIELALVNRIEKAIEG